MFAQGATESTTPALYFQRPEQRSGGIMARIPGKIDWCDVGKLVIEYWKTYDKEALQAALQDYANNAAGAVEAKAPTIRIIYDDADSNEINITIPANPWSDDELKRIEEMECYCRDLGLVVFAGCR